MTPKFTHSVDRETGIVTRVFKGDIYAEDVINSWNILFEKEELSGIKGVINDFSDASLKMQPSDLHIIISFLKKHMDIFKHVKLAVVSNNPANVIFPSLASHENPDLKIKPFSTAESARLWILSK